MSESWISKPWFRSYFRYVNLEDGRLFSFYKSPEDIGIIRRIMVSILGRMPIYLKEQQDTIICIDHKYNEYYVSKVIKNNTDNTTSYFTTCLCGKVGFFNTEEPMDEYKIARLFFKSDNFSFGLDTRQTDINVLDRYLYKALKRKGLKEPTENTIEEIVMSKDEAKYLYSIRQTYAAEIFPDFLIFRPEYQNHSIIPYRVKTNIKIKSRTPTYTFDMY